jgi:hypothetical protein
MDICHEHNRRAGAGPAPRPFGLRLSLPPGDPMRKVLGDDWHEFQWFESEMARDAKIGELTGRFAYYRKGDRPTFVIERVVDGEGPE